MKRREFLQLGSAAIAASGLLGLSHKSQASSLLASNSADYKALVCIFLHGGNDGFNMIVPASDFAYDEYASARQNLAIAKADLLPISPLSTGAGQYGLHPQMSEVQQLFANGKLGVMANVGNLIEPVTKAQLQDPNTPKPRQLFSHNDQQDQWKYGDPLTVKTGWGGRLADYAVSENTNPLLTSISIDGKSRWLSSQQTLDLSIGRNGFDRYDYVRPETNWTADRRAAFKQLLELNNQSALVNEFSGLQARTMDLVEDVGETLSLLPDFTTSLPATENRLAERLQMVAKLIAARDTIGMQKQVFFVEMGGFDTHDAQLQNQPQLLAQVSQAMKYFYDVTVELGVGSDVTSFTCSEFGRTLTSNGDGTDHAWGNHQLVMGDAVRGGDIFGTMPSLEIGGIDDINDDGRIIPTTSVEQYVVSMLRWYGMSEGEIATILPNLSAFDQNSIDLML